MRGEKSGEGVRYYSLVSRAYRTMDGAAAAVTFEQAGWA